MKESKMRTILSYGLLIYWISLGFISLAQQPLKSPVPFWHDSFESFSGTNNTSDYIGFFTQKPGVHNQCMNFDGFTTTVVCPADKLPDLKNGFTVEAWIAPQEYPWNWTGLFDHANDTTSGLSFGINYLGQIGFQAFADGKWMEILSPEPVPLLKWSHVAGSYHPTSGFVIYINGLQAAEKSITKGVDFQQSLPVVIGKSHRKQFPALTERVTSMKFLTELFFDGLIDEIKVYDKPLQVQEIKTAFQSKQPSNPQPLQYRVLPSGPEKKNTFGAFYTHLNYCPEWDRLWPVGEQSDVLVTFDQLPVKMIFWRGTGYCPSWVTENGKWISDQGPESWNFNTLGCFEQMSDKQCRYSHVRIIENTEARVVVHWRTASPAIDYSFNHIDPQTGWGEWTDEYYYIYPDAVAVRYQEIHGPRVAGMEWQQTELINQPGTRPQDNVHLQAMTIANMNGETETWSWEKPYGRRAERSDSISNGMIAVMNLKSKQKHFVIGETGAYWKPFTFGAREGFSTIPTWNHWPAATLPNDGRVAPTADRPSSSCFGTLYPVKHKSDRYNMMTGRNLYGLTEKTAAELATLARSWNSPSQVKVIGDGFESKGYDMNQRAYIIWNNKTEGIRKLHITLEGSENSPILNPAFVIENWNGGEIALKMDGKKIEKGENFRVGKLTTLEGAKTIVWIKTESKTKINLELE